MSRLDRSHPDDALRALAKRRSSSFGPTIYTSSRPPRDDYRERLIALILLVAGFSAIVLYPFAADRHIIAIDGITDGATVTGSALRDNPIRFRITPASAMTKATVRINGAPGRAIEEATTLRWLPPELPEGKHELTVTSGGRTLWRGPARKKITFRVDSKPPTLVVDPPSTTNANAAFVVTGSVDEEVDLTVGGVAVPVVDGRFSHSFASPPIGSVRIVAKDRAGSTDEEIVRTSVTLPLLRGVHVSAESWVDAPTRALIMQLVAEKRINLVVIDLKDESGNVWFSSQTPMAQELRAVQARFDLRVAAEEIHRAGARLGGRIVALRDPRIAAKGTADPSDDLLVRASDGSVFNSTYGPYANVASRRVQDYIAALAREAADAGVDDVFLTDVARPDGLLATMRFPGLVGTEPVVPEVITDVTTPSTPVAAPSVDPDAVFDEAVTGFVERVGQRLQGTKTRLGVVVSAYSAKKPKETGENVTKLAQVVDYITPMLLPSEFRPRSFGVLEPPRYPGIAVGNAVSGFPAPMRRSGSDAVLVPWIQDFSQGRTFGVRQVKAQINALAEWGVDRYLLWDPRATYTRAAIPVIDGPEDQRAAGDGSPAGDGGNAGTVAEPAPSDAIVAR